MMRQRTRGSNQTNHLISFNQSNYMKEQKSRNNSQIEDLKIGQKERLPIFNDKKILAYDNYID